MSALPVISTLMTSKPFRQELLMTTVGMFWLLMTVFYPPLLERSFWVVLVGARVFAVCALTCGCMTVYLGKGSDAPLNLFIACGMVIPVISIVVALRQEKVSDHVFVRRLDACEAIDLADISANEASKSNTLF